MILPGFWGGFINQAHHTAHETLCSLPRNCPPSTGVDARAMPGLLFLDRGLQSQGDTGIAPAHPGRTGTKCGVDYSLRHVNTSCPGASTRISNTPSVGFTHHGSDSNPPTNRFRHYQRHPRQDRYQNQISHQDLPTNPHAPPQQNPHNQPYPHPTLGFHPDRPPGAALQGGLADQRGDGHDPR